MSIKEIKSATLYKEYAVEIPYQEINGIIDEKLAKYNQPYPYQDLGKEKPLSVL